MSDRVVTTLGVDDAGADAVETHRDLIQAETLTTELVIDRRSDLADRVDAVAVGAGSAVTVEVRRA